MVPVLEGAGGVISDWTGERLTLANHEKSKGRVVACANKELHSQALKILSTSTHEDEDVGSTIDDPLLAALDDTLPMIPSKSIDSNFTPLICGVMLGEVFAHLGQ